ncbi:MAG: hypothetical protein EOP20_08565 [Hyphomicrobiales bacterium]|nr:MAG: hypothetical protein EOP20_08565 [Hyphomicrobiales bacterium]
MPLPPAPTKRAALLSPDALDAPAHASTRGGRRSGASRQADDPRKNGSRPLELFDARPEDAGGAPAGEVMRQIETKARPPLVEPASQPQQQHSRGDDSGLYAVAS